MAGQMAEGTELLLAAEAPIRLAQLGGIGGDRHRGQVRIQQRLTQQDAAQSSAGQQLGWIPQIGVGGQKSQRFQTRLLWLPPLRIGEQLGWQQGGMEQGLRQLRERGFQGVAVLLSRKAQAPMASQQLDQRLWVPLIPLAQGLPQAPTGLFRIGSGGGLLHRRRPGSGSIGAEPYRAGWRKRRS